MKSLVLKDLYNVGHTARSMLFIMAVLAVAFLSTSGVEGYIFMCAVLCSIMIVTTFAFDDASKWERYAMITPISRKDLVAGKFIVLAIFCAAGSLFGLIAGTVGGTVLKKMSLDPAGIGGLLLLAEVRHVLGGKFLRRHTSSSSTTGQWSLPSTSARIEAETTRGISRSDTIK